MQAVRGRLTKKQRIAAGALVLVGAGAVASFSLLVYFCHQALAATQSDPECFNPASSDSNIVGVPDCNTGMNQTMTAFCAAPCAAALRALNNVGWAVPVFALTAIGTVGGVWAMHKSLESNSENRSGEEESLVPE